MSGETFVNIEGLNEAQELKSVPQGEYQVRVVSCEVKTSKNTGGDFLQAQLEIIGEPLTKNINHVMMFPTNSDDAKKQNNRKLAIRNFLQACGIDTSKGFNPSELEGCTAWAILAEEDDPEYGKQNRVRKWVGGK